MGPLEIILGILVILISLIIIGIVILQQSQRRGVNGVISGGLDTFLSKNKTKTADAMLARWTKIFAVVFFVLAIIANVIAIVL